MLLTPPTPEGRGPPSLRPKPNPRKSKVFEVVRSSGAAEADESIVKHDKKNLVTPQWAVAHSG